MSLFSFPDDNFSKYQWIFTNLVCVLILWRSGLGLLMGKFHPIFDSYLPTACPYFHSRMITLVNINGFSPNFVCAFIMWRYDLGLLIVKFHQFRQLSACNMRMVGYYRFTFLFQICRRSMTSFRLG